MFGFRSGRASACRRKALCAVVASVFLFICAGCYKAPAPQRPRFDLVRTSYAAGDVLAAQLEKSPVGKKNAIASSTFVNIDSLSRSSTFGRILSEQIASRLYQKGFRMIELKMRSQTVSIKEEAGEFVLSRKLQNLSRKHDIEAFLVGTYAASGSFVFISTKVVSASDNAVLASHDYSMPINSQIRALLEGKK